MNIKNGQFLAPWEMENVLKKAHSTGNERLTLCKRDTSFGYGNQVVDMRGLETMKTFAPVVFNATHLPGKPLVDICGKLMVQRVYEGVRRVRLFDEVLVATDDACIMSAAASFGGRACMTSADGPSGSDRFIEVATAHPADIYVNMQGDEPLVEADSIEKLAHAMLEDSSLQMETLCYPISVKQAQNPNLVKVVRAHNGNSLYFSRSPRPFPRSGGIFSEYFGHLGMYAYRRDFLMNFGSLPYSSLENTEKLEQLRVLQAGISIRVLEVDAMRPGVDTPENLGTVRCLCKGNGFITF